jgi:hypothetical protein
MARTGTGTIPVGLPTYYVAEPSVGATSMVEVMLTSDPGSYAGGACVEAVHKVAGYGLTIELIVPPQNATTFDYLVS